MEDLESLLARHEGVRRCAYDARQRVLVSMCFNLGVAGLLAFKQMLAPCERGDYGWAVEGDAGLSMG